MCVVVGVNDKGVDWNIRQFGGRSADVHPDCGRASGTVHSLKDVAFAIATRATAKPGKRHISNVAGGTRRIHHDLCDGSSRQDAAVGRDTCPRRSGI